MVPLKHMHQTLLYAALTDLKTKYPNRGGLFCLYVGESCPIQGHNLLTS